MQNVHLAGATRNVGSSQGYVGISVLYGHKSIDLNGIQHEARTCTTAWRPEPDELARLNAGASIYLELLTMLQTPMLLTVGEVP